MPQHKRVQQLPELFPTFIEATSHRNRPQHSNLIERSWNLLLCPVVMLRTHFGSTHPSNTSGSTLLDFTECSGYETSKYIWAVCTSLCCAVGFPLCVAILWEMFQTRRKGSPLTPHDFFILNLTVMDAVFLASIPPGMINHLTWRNLWFDYVWNGVYNLNTCGRPLMMVCVCLDCYLAVVHPITYHTRKSLTPRAVMAAVVWTLTVAFGLAAMTHPNLLLNMVITAPFIVAIVMIAVCDYFILHTLIKSGQGKNNIHPQKQRALQTLINSLVLTLVSYLPPVLMYAIGLSLTRDQKFLMCVIAIPATMTSSLGSIVMPLLHLHNIGKLDCFRCGCCRKE